MPTETTNAPSERMGTLSDTGVTTKPRIAAMGAAFDEALGIAPEAPVEPPKQPDPPVAPPTATTPPTKPAEAQRTPAPEAKAKKDGISEVREALERAQKRVQELEASHTSTSKEKADAYAKAADMEAKVAKYEERINKEFGPAMERLKVTERELQQREETLRVTNYQATAEFHDKYVKPLAEARAEADMLMQELQVEMDDGKFRQATKEDFDAVMAAPNLTVATQTAKRIFGPDVYPTVVSLRNRIHSHERSRREGVARAGEDSIKWEKDQEQTRLSHQQAFRNRLQERINAALDADPEFKVPDDDKEAKDALAEGEAFGRKLLEGDPSWTPDQFVENIAKAQTIIRKHNVREKRILKLEKELAETKEQLKAYHKSEPDLTGRSGGAAPVNGQSGKSKFATAFDDAAAKANRY